MTWAALIHWLHLMAAILWVGGMLFVSLAVQPALRRLLGSEARLSVYAEVGRRYNAILWGSWSVLLATGTARLWLLREPRDFFAGEFGAVLALKLALFAGMAALSLLHAYRWGPRLAEIGPAHPDYAGLVRRTAFWGKANLLIAVAIVGCAAWLRFLPW